MEQLPPEVQEKAQQLQEIQQQAQSLAQQKQQLEMDKQETKRALEELGDVEEDSSIYKSLGGVMVETDLEDAEEELQSKQETLSLRLKQVENQEEKAKKKLQELREEIQGSLQGQGLAGGAV